MVRHVLLDLLRLQIEKKYHTVLVIAQAQQYQDNTHTTFMKIRNEALVCSKH